LTTASCSKAIELLPEDRVPAVFDQFQHVGVYGKAGGPIPIYRPADDILEKFFAVRYIAFQIIKVAPVGEFVIEPVRGTRAYHK